MPSLPPSTDPLTILQDAWHRLQDGQAHADRPFRTPTLATADALGRPDVRTVVLRHVDPDARHIDFQTDRRSPKFFALQHNASAAWLFYDRGDQLQLRIQTAVTLHTHDGVADSAWAGVPESARQPYRAPLAAGAELPSLQAGGESVSDSSPGGHVLTEGDARANFAVVRGRIESIEWLRLVDGAGGKHWRRIRFAWPNGELEWKWLAP